MNTTYTLSPHSLTPSHPIHTTLPHISHLTPSHTTFFTAIPMGGTGVIVGALIIHFTKSKGRRVSLIHAIISLLLILPMLMFLVHCPTLDLAGVTVGYQDG